MRNHNSDHLNETTERRPQSHPPSTSSPTQHYRATHPLNGMVVAHVINGNVALNSAALLDLSMFWNDIDTPRGATGRLVFLPDEVQQRAISGPPKINHGHCEFSAHKRMATDPDQPRDSSGLMLCKGCDEPIFFCYNSDQFHHVNPEAEACSHIHEKRR